MVSMEVSLLVTVHSTDLRNDGRITGVEPPVLTHHSVKTMLWTSLAHLQPWAMCWMVLSAVPQHLHVVPPAFPCILVATGRAWLASSQLNPLILECAQDFLARLFSLRWSVK